YFGWFASATLSFNGLLGTSLFTKGVWDEAIKKQKGPPPSPSRAQHDYAYARLSLAIYDGQDAARKALESEGWEPDKEFGLSHPGYSYRSQLYRHDGRQEFVM